MYLSWTCHVCLRTKITFINKLCVNNLTLALEDKQQQLGCVEKKAEMRWTLQGSLRETGQLHKNASTAASEVDTSLRCSRNRGLMRESYLPCSVCMPRLDARLVKQSSFSDGRPSALVCSLFTCGNMSSSAGSGTALRSKPLFWLSAPGNSSSLKKKKKSWNALRLFSSPLSWNNQHGSKSEWWTTNRHSHRFHGTKMNQSNR